MYSIKKSFAAVALAGIFAVASFAQSQPGPAGRPHGDRLAVLTKALNLSDAQVTSIRSSMQNERPALKADFQDLKAKREALKAASSAQSPNPAAVGSAFLALRASQANLKADRQKLHAAIANVLTPDQQKTMKALKVMAQARHPRFRAFSEGPMSMGS